MNEAWPFVPLVQDGDQPWVWYCSERYDQEVRPREPASADLQARAAFRRLERLWPNGFSMPAALDNLSRGVCISAEAVLIYYSLVQARGVLRSELTEPNKRQAKRTRRLLRQCRRGHDFVAENTGYLHKQGKTERYCLTCKKLASKRWTDANKVKVREMWRRANDRYRSAGKRVTTEDQRERNKLYMRKYRATKIEMQLKGQADG